ncbi:prohibitin family protein, partial [Burkholderia pseudomallei]|uniref:prohibitin family protein n=1 Tax=Burkholderia pseudomallei TaxID=28450 RepID=UPI001F29F682
RARDFLSDKRGLSAGRPVCAPRHFLPEIPIKTASKLIVAAVLFLVLLSIVTPWLMNQDSSITLLAVPFVWLAYAAAFVKFIPPSFQGDQVKRLFLILILAPTMFLAAGCDNVPAGYVGVKVQRYGDDRGVNVEVKGPGRYFNGPNVDMFIFPTFTQSYVWDKAGKSDESFTFQTVEGLSVNTDIGVSYAIPRENAPKVFQKYRRGVDEITGVYLRAIVRDALNLAGASMAVEDVYGRGKAALQQRVEDEVKANAAKVGISVEKVYFVNQMRLPEQVMNSINGKIAATQIAQQKENELRAAEADAAKQVAIAKGEAEALEVKAKALRENSQILQQMAIEKWDGKLPQY